jgi:hypothetical protein
MANNILPHPDKQPAFSSAPHTRKAILVLLSLALVAAIVYGVVITKEKYTLTAELTSAKSALALTQTQLNSTK